MLKVALRRIVLFFITLWLLSLIVFVISHILPGNVGRAMLGPFADQRAVDLRNQELGTDRPLLEQYVDWFASFLTGDMGNSFAMRQPVAPFVMEALGNSLRLALVALCMVVPLGILGGIVAALHVGRPLDRIITVGGLSAAIVPEFISGIVLILVFGIWLDWLPLSAAAPEGAGFLELLSHLILPAIPLVFVLFGYIARMTRAGMVEALDSDYMRTAMLKGLRRQTAIRRHALRNALLPTVSVIATQTVYLLGGLVAIEVLFHYRGIGSLIFTAAQKKDFPMLQASVLMVGAIFTLVSLTADVVYAWLNPRIRLGAAT